MKKNISDDDLMYIVLCIPKDAEKLKITASWGKNTARMKMNQKEIAKARKDYLYIDPYDDALDTYVLTDKGRRLLEKINNNCSGITNEEAELLNELEEILQDDR